MGNPIINKNMIKSLSIKNLQSHKESRLEFAAPGVNIIVGQSRTGKSVLFRGLEKLARNRPTTGIESWVHNQDPKNIIMMKLKRMLIEQFDLAKKFIGEKNARLAMIYKLNKRDAADKEKDDEKKLVEVPRVDTLVKEMPDDEEQKAQAEEHEEDENLLTIDESMNQEEGGPGGG